MTTTRWRIDSGSCRPRGRTLFTFFSSRIRPYERRVTAVAVATTYRVVRPSRAVRMRRAYLKAPLVCRTTDGRRESSAPRLDVSAFGIKMGREGALGKRVGRGGLSRVPYTHPGRNDRAAWGMACACIYEEEGKKSREGKDTPVVRSGSYAGVKRVSCVPFFPPFIPRRQWGSR